MNDFIGLLDVCTKTNICSLDRSVYEYADGIGIPIGYPLGSTIAEIFEKRFEEELFEAALELSSHVVTYTTFYAFGMGLGSLSRSSSQP